MHRWPAGTAVPGVERASGPVRVSCVREVGTLSGAAAPGAGMRRRCGRPTVRGAEVPGGIGVPRKRMPGSRKAALRHEVARVEWAVRRRFGYADGIAPGLCPYDLSSPRGALPVTAGC